MRKTNHHHCRPMARSAALASATFRLWVACNSVHQRRQTNETCATIIIGRVPSPPPQARTQSVRSHARGHTTRPRAHPNTKHGRTTSKSLRHSQGASQAYQRHLLEWSSRNLIEAIAVRKTNQHSYRPLVQRSPLYRPQTMGGV